jgi:FAD:protein FMN transferase
MMKKPIGIKFLHLAAVCIGLIALLAGCGPQAFREQRLALSRDSSIPVSVTVYAKATPDWNDVYGFIGKLADIYDFRSPKGPVYQLNNSHSAVFTGDVLDTLRISIKYGELSHGAFDITILPLSSLWSVNTRTTLPDPKDVIEAKNRVDYRKIRIDADGTVRMPEGFGIDLGGIAQGAIADALAKYLEGKGYSDFLIDISGDILIRGIKPGNKQWVVGIEHPRKKGTLIHKVKIGSAGSRISINTSGDYEQFFMIGDKRYHHIIDPATGYPAQGIIAVTVIAPTCTDSDALCKCAFVLGYEKGAEFLEKLPDVEGLLVRENNGKIEEKMTRGFAKYLAD